MRGAFSRCLGPYLCDCVVARSDGELVLVLLLPIETFFPKTRHSSWYGLGCRLVADITVERVVVNTPPVGEKFKKDVITMRSAEVHSKITCLKDLLDWVGSK